MITKIRWKRWEVHSWVLGRLTAFLETSLSSSSLLASMNSLRRLGKLAWLGRQLLIYRYVLALFEV